MKRIAIERAADVAIVGLRTSPDAPYPLSLRRGATITHVYIGGWQAEYKVELDEPFIVPEDGAYIVREVADGA